MRCTGIAPTGSRATNREVLTHEPANVEARNALATIYSLQNRFDEAIAEFGILLKSDPKLAHVYNNLG